MTRVPAFVLAARQATQVATTSGSGGANALVVVLLACAVVVFATLWTAVGRAAVRRDKAGR